MATELQIALDRTESFSTLYIFATRAGIQRMMSELAELAAGRRTDQVVHPSAESYSEDVGGLALHLVSEPAPAGRLRRLVRTILGRGPVTGILCSPGLGGYPNVDIHGMQPEFEDLLELLHPVLNGPDRCFCNWGVNAADSAGVVVELRHLLPFQAARVGLLP